MGHVANKIDAKDKKLSEILHNNRYRIDSFQREYRWQRAHIEELISDLSSSFLKNYKEGDSIEDYIEYDCYYMGPIVLCSDKNEISIVDGQQRLTSFSLLLIFLLHSQNKLGVSENLKKDLKQYLYVNKAGKLTFTLNVEQRNNIIEHLILHPHEAFLGSDEDESVMNLLSRYEDIESFFPQDIYSSTVLPIFIEWLLDKVVLVEVKAYSMENAYTIFETMNDRGLTLTPSEILKGYLLSQIEDPEKSNDANEFWRNRIGMLKSVLEADNADMDFFRAWFRAKYAVTKRKSSKDSINEDFENIGTNFHTWIKNNRNKVSLIESDNFYYFIKSDMNFYSNIFMQLHTLRSKSVLDYENIYVSGYYTIADSLFYPLMMAPILKSDNEEIVKEKLMIVGRFIDVFINSRTLLEKSISQASIRNLIYDIIKNIRNKNPSVLRSLLSEQLESLSELPTYIRMHNWGYFHYFFARVIYNFDESEDFKDLLRSRKQRSYILVPLFSEENMPDGYDQISWQAIVSSIGNYCLIRRNNWSEFEQTKDNRGLQRMKYLLEQNYLPELSNLGIQIHEDWSISDFINTRNKILRQLTEDLWRYK